MGLKAIGFCATLILFTGMCFQTVNASEQTDSKAEIDYDYIKEDTVLTSHSTLQPEDIELYQSLNVDGKKYKLEKYADNVTENIVTLEDSVQKENLAAKSWKPEKVLPVKYNDKEVQLTLDHVEYAKEAARAEDIEVTQEYDQGEVQASITYDYTDAMTDQTVQVQLILQEQSTIRQEWRSILKIPITIYDYDAGYYEFSGYEFYLGSDGQLDIRGKEQAILDYLGLNSGKNRITGIQWSGDSYVSDGIVCRQAIATGDQLIDRIEATYAGSVECPQTYTGMAYYSGEVPDGTYTHHLTLYYSVQRNPTVLILSVALVVILIAAVAILFIIKNKKKQEPKGTNQ